MNTPTMFDARTAALDTHVLPAYFPAPGLGLVPINAFVIRSAQPVLIDTSFAAVQEGFARALASVIPIEELRWLWLTHADPDHIGSLHRLLAMAPQLRVVTTYVGMAKLSLLAPVPLDRLYLLNPGQELDVGDRRLVCMKPPTYDAPETTALFDTKTRVLISSDSFGAVVQSPAETAEAMEPAALRDGLRLWATIDAPWLPLVAPARFGATLERVRALAPSAILSSHLPPAHGMTDRLLSWMDSARSAPPFVGLDQAAFANMVAAAAAA
jgi:flavorubredoxin